MSNNKIKIGLIGAGDNTKLRHIPGFQKLNNVEIISVSNRSIQSSTKIAKEYNIPVIHKNWKELIEDTNIDAVCIGTWPNMHHTLAIESLKNNKHVLTDARMAMNSHDAHKMLNASKSKPHLITQIVPAPITFKVDSTIKKIIEEDALGNILSVDLSTHNDASGNGGFLDEKTTFHWRENRDISGYNIMQMGIWYETLMRWLGTAQSVISLTKVNVNKRRDQNNDFKYITIPDHVEILSELNIGAIAHMRFSSVTGLAPDDKLWIFGSKGTLMLDINKMDIYIGKKETPNLSKIDIPKEDEGYWRVEEEFINSILGLEEVTHTSFEDGVKYMEFTEAVTKSMQSGKKINLPL